VPHPRVIFLAPSLLLLLLPCSPPVTPLLSPHLPACLQCSQGYTVVHILASMGKTKEVRGILNLAHLATDSEVPDGDVELYRR
jgi:hypothetical protein